MFQLRADNFSQALAHATKHGLESGALVPISTQAEICTDHELTFVLRLLSGRKLSGNDGRMAAATLTHDGSAPSSKTNPFLPYDDNLYVGHLSPGYVCLLNKFNVLPDHFLIVTADFQEQTEALTLADFEAVQMVLDALPALVFFNGGKLAGASQRHKHLQALPLPSQQAQHSGVTDLSHPMPLAPYLDSLPSDCHQVPAFRFKHFFQRWPAFSAPARYAAYLHHLRSLGFDSEKPSMPAPYNLVMTRQWSLLIPRRQEHFQGMSVNALGFVGTLLVRDSRQSAYLAEAGPLHLLQAVCFAED